VAPSIKTVLKITERGFTGHEHVDHAYLIHMNGRIYDPEIGRFMHSRTAPYGTNKR
jgi:RHS repeat-associated protein